MNPKFKRYMLAHITAILLILASSALAGIAVMAWLFQVSDISDKRAYAIGVVVAFATLSYLLRITYFQKLKFTRMKAMASRTTARIRGQRKWRRSYARYHLEKANRRSRPYFESDFGREVHPTYFE